MKCERPSCCYSEGVYLCCISLQIKSCASSEILLNRDRITSKVFFRFGSNEALYSSTFLIAWARQHCWLIFLSCATCSSFTISSPSVAHIVNTTPKSNRSYFFSSLREESKLSSYKDPAVLPC